MQHVTGKGHGQLPYNIYIIYILKKRKKEEEGKKKEEEGKKERKKEGKKERKKERRRAREKKQGEQSNLIKFIGKLVLLNIMCMCQLISS